MAISKFQVEMMQDAIAVHHEEGEYQCCTPAEPCHIVRLYTERLEANGYTGYANPVETQTTRPQAGSAATNQYGTFQVHAASEKQVGFLTRLLEQRDWSGLDKRNSAIVQRAADTLAAGTLSKRLATDAINILLANTTDPNVKMASPKQVALLQRLITERENNLGLDASTLDTLTAAQASTAIDLLFKAPRRQQAAEVVLEAGMYRTPEGQIFKVYKGQSGRMLAKALVIDGDETYFDYRGLASRFVKADQRMSLEDAKQFGVIYGVCCVCSRTLTDEDSIANGIGPVCASRV